MVLDELQEIVNAGSDYPTRVALARSEWSQKTSTNAKAAAFIIIRRTLAEMCVGPIRCAYCEDSLADEVEHIRPKSLFPEQVFDCYNFLYACGPCNGPKSDRYGILVGIEVTEFVRRRGAPVLAPPAGQPGFIDPRTEDPLRFMELDMGGVTPNGDYIEGTFELLPADGLMPAEAARARFTIDVLGLNREVIRVARANAFGGFRARLREYAESKDNRESENILRHMKDDILSTPHLTVFAEMRRQRALLPEIDVLFERIPEALDWPIVR